MKINILIAASVAFASLGVAAPAPAVTIVAAKCGSVSDAAGCLFEGNMGNVGDAADAQTQYNALRNPDIVLDFLGKSDGGFGTVTYDDATNTVGTWSAPGFTIDYLAVKSGPEFVLYKVTDNKWDTDGLTNKKGTRQALSHLTFFGTRSVAAVPEPATWAMMIGGFGMVGGSMRYRRRSKSTSANA